MHRLLGSIWLLLLFVATLQAQQQPRSFERWDVRAAALPSPPGTAPLGVSSVHVSRRDYRYEGLALGGVTFGALGAWVGSQITEACPTEPGVDCSPDRLGNALAMGLVSAAVGGGLGYLVGRLSSKPEPSAPQMQLTGRAVRNSGRRDDHRLARVGQDPATMEERR